MSSLTCQQSSPTPTHRKGDLLYPRMSTPNPYSHPSFFPTHAIVRNELRLVSVPSTNSLSDVYRWDIVVVIATATSFAFRTMRSQELALGS